MKKLFFTLTAIIVTIITIYAQSPQSFKYQAVARNISGDILANQSISIRISIHETSPGGTVVYEEEHVSVPTNEFGLVNLEIGDGFPISGTFSAIDWGSNSHFIEIEMDETGGTSYLIMGTAQLLSVPYALHSKTAESVTETDPVFGISVAGGITGTDTTNWNNKLDGYTETDPVYGSSVASGITGTDTTNWNNKLDSYTETDPVFGISVASGITGTDTTNWNNKLDSYTETDPVYGLSVASGITGTDTTNWNNKLDSYTETDPVFGISVASGITGTDTTNWNNKLDTEVDGDITNELQNLSLSGDTIFISNGNYIVIPGVANLSFTCGNFWTDTRDGQTYATVQIGSQCWMAENLNIGTRIDGVNDQTNNATIEKYCYADNSSNCDTYGGLYQWDEMMQYITIEETQGVCPVGWHIPTDAEWCILENFVDATTDPGCNLTGYRGTDGGTKLKQGGSSGFEALLAGYRFTDGLFSNSGTYTSFWSSTESGSDAWRRYLYAAEARVYRATNVKLYGFSVRCLKD